jgi:hypothetical protein
MMKSVTISMEKKNKKKQSLIYMNKKMNRSMIIMIKTFKKIIKLIPK